MSHEDFTSACVSLSSHGRWMVANMCHHFGVALLWMGNDSTRCVWSRQGEPVLMEGTWVLFQ